MMITKTKAFKTMTMVVFIIMVVLPSIYSFHRSITIAGNPYEYDLLTNNQLTLFLNVMIYMIPLVFAYFGAMIATTIQDMATILFTRTKRSRLIKTTGLKVWGYAMVLTIGYLMVSWITLYCCYDHNGDYGTITRLFDMTMGYQSYYEFSDIFYTTPWAYRLIWIILISIYSGFWAVLGYGVAMIIPKGAFVALGLFVFSLVLMVVFNALPFGLTIYTPQMLFNPRGVNAYNTTINDLKMIVRLIYLVLPLLIVIGVSYQHDH